MSDGSTQVFCFDDGVRICHRHHMRGHYATAALVALLVWPVLCCHADGPKQVKIKGRSVITVGSGGELLKIKALEPRCIIEMDRLDLEGLELQVDGTLIRVTGEQPSNITGFLALKHNLWIVNPNGILIGPQSVLDVGRLLESRSMEDFASRSTVTATEHYLGGEKTFVRGGGNAGAHTLQTGDGRVGRVLLLKR